MEATVDPAAEGSICTPTARDMRVAMGRWIGGRPGEETNLRRLPSRSVGEPRGDDPE